MSKFTVTKNRLMTMAEVEEQLEALKLPEAAATFIRDTFLETWDNNEVVNEDGTGASKDSGYYGPYVADEGRIGWWCSHEDVFEDLCEALGLDHGNMSQDEDAKANEIYDKFFTE